jgi:hypothetical protein
MALGKRLRTGEEKCGVRGEPAARPAIRALPQEECEQDDNRDRNPDKPKYKRASEHKILLVLWRLRNSSIASYKSMIRCLRFPKTRWRLEFESCSKTSLPPEIIEISSIAYSCDFSLQLRKLARNARGELKFLAWKLTSRMWSSEVVSAGFEKRAEMPYLCRRAAEVSRGDCSIPSRPIDIAEEGASATTCLAVDRPPRARARRLRQMRQLGHDQYAERAGVLQRPEPGALDCPFWSSGILYPHATIFEGASASTINFRMMATKATVAGFPALSGPMVRRSLAAVTGLR